MVDEVIDIQVAYATVDKQMVIAVQLAAGSSVQQAIAASDIQQHFQDMDITRQKVGIFGQVCPLTREVVSGDRIEIYRPLKQNPMQARRSRAGK